MVNTTALLYKMLEANQNPHPSFVRLLGRKGVWRSDDVLPETSHGSTAEKRQVYQSSIPTSSLHDSWAI